MPQSTSSLKVKHRIDAELHARHDGGKKSTIRQVVVELEAKMLIFQGWLSSVSLQYRCESMTNLKSKSAIRSGTFFV
jgi:hypothetical protein